MRKRLIIRKDERAVSPVIATILMVAITVVLAAVLYVMVTGLLTGPGGGPQTIGVQVGPHSPTHFVLTVITVPAAHAVTTTTFLLRWANQTTVINEDLETLKTETVGVTYLPVNGASQTGLAPNDILRVSKDAQYGYVNGMPFTFSDGTTILFTGQL